jgi:prevent-host-death family protein
MLVNTEKMIPVTRLQKELTQKLREVSEKKEPLYVLRNNTVVAVILPAEEYERLKVVEELLEHLEIAEMVEKRLKGHDRSKNIPWEKVKKQHGL